MKKVLYILFHRSVVVGLSLLAQVVSLIVMVMFFSGHTQGFYWCCIALSVVAAMLILGSSIDPAYKIAWLLLVLPFPVFGGIFYLLVGGGHIPKRITRRMKRIAEQSAENLKADFKADDLLPLGEDAASQARYLENYACCPAYTNTRTEYFPVGDLAFVRMLEELEKELGIDTYAMNWPIGCGKEFKGVYDRQNRKVIHFTSNTNAKAATATVIEPDDPALADLIGAAKRDQLVDEIDLLDGASCDFDLDRVRHGKLSPVFFGSALTNFGVEPFLEEFLRMTTAPLPRKAGDEIIDSFDEDFSAFVFKIQANMNKAHRDRIAFMRVVSGKFQADKEVYHVQGGKKIRLSRPQQLMAAEREIIEEAYAGDIIGVFDPGIFSIGDTLCSPSKKFKFDPIPTFAPEHFQRIRSIDTMKRKQFLKGVEQIAQEGAIQIFKTPYTGMEEVIVGVVGTLQFDVLEYRLRSEYNVELYKEGLPYEYLRWIVKEDEDAQPLKEEDLLLPNDAKLVEDYKGNQLLLFASQWSIQWVQDRNKNLKLAEFGGARF